MDEPRAREKVLDGMNRSPCEVTDPRSLREHLGAFATGVVVVTVGGEQPHGMTANAFTSVSLDPPLVLICVAHSAIMHAALVDNGSFGVSVLGVQHEDTARYFADRRRPLGGAQFDEVRWTAGERTGAPLIDGALAQFECELWRWYDGGDHTIFLGHLVSMRRQPGNDALLFLNGRFHHLSERTDAAT